MIILALRVTHAGTWETWEDELTFDRLASLRKSIEIAPPEFMTLQAIAMWAGAIKTPEAGAQSSGRSSGQGAISAEQFITLFGSGGEIGATGTHN